MTLPSPLHVTSSLRTVQQAQRVCTLHPDRTWTFQAPCKPPSNTHCVSPSFPRQQACMQCTHTHRRLKADGPDQLAPVDNSRHRASLHQDPSAVPSLPNRSLQLLGARSPFAALHLGPNSHPLLHNTHRTSTATPPRCGH